MLQQLTAYLLVPLVTAAFSQLKSPGLVCVAACMFAAGMCFYRQDGLWTYEICHRKHVRQFRQVRLLAQITYDCIGST